MQFDNSAPIWQQLVHECSRRIVTGEWPAGGKVPGVRDLAVEMGVNPNTMQRALSELDRDGITVSDRTVGRYVTGDTTRIDELRGTLAATSVDEFIRKVQGLGASLNTAQALLADRWRKQEGDQE